jgi:hypothetical protein
MAKPGGDPSSGISLGDALILPQRHPACRRRDVGRVSPPCARSKISSWRDGALYPLAGRRRARRRIMPELEATAPPISFLVLSGGGRRGRAMGSASPTAGLQQHGEGMP